MLAVMKPPNDTRRDPTAAASAAARVGRTATTDTKRAALANEITRDMSLTPCGGMPLPDVGSGSSTPRVLRADAGIIESRAGSARVAEVRGGGHDFWHMAGTSRGTTMTKPMKTLAPD